MFVEHVIVPDELSKIHFHCQYELCHGRCCVEGDAGAPLEFEEIRDLEKNAHLILSNVEEDAREVLEKNGFFDFDLEGKPCTPLKSNNECVFMAWENGIARCILEKLYECGLFSWKKPISCHLYPIRVKNEGIFERLELHRWSICYSAFQVSNVSENRLIFFLSEALIRKYGMNWYRRLLILSGFDPDLFLNRTNNKDYKKCF
ncbi:MAG: DUF3109 family protein [Bacteroidales bacterium]|nr:DUF3109 family protein [Bacteroidales bacterium]